MGGPWVTMRRPMMPAGVKESAVVLSAGLGGAAMSGACVSTRLNPLSALRSLRWPLMADTAAPSGAAAAALAAPSCSLSLTRTQAVISVTGSVRSTESTGCRSGAETGAVSTPGSGTACVTCGRLPYTTVVVVAIPTASIVFEELSA